MRCPRLRFVSAGSVLAAALLVGLWSFPARDPGVRAQDAATPSAGPLVATTGAASSPLRETLFQATLEGLPKPPAFIRMVRITLAPGAGVPAHSHPGPEFGRVESGVLTVETGGQAVIAQVGEDGVPQPVRLPPVGEPFPLRAGDQIAYPASVPFGFSNQGQQAVTLLAAVILPAGSQRPLGAQWVDGTPGPNAFQGVSSQILGDAIASAWPTGPVTIAIDRLALAPGEAIPVRNGPVLLSVELGKFAFAFVEGAGFQVSRGGTLPEPNATPGTAYELSPGDAVFFPGGMSEVPRGASDGVLVLLRMSVLPSRVPAAATPVPGAPTATPAPGAPNTTPAPAAAAPRFAVGARASVNESGVRLRDQPSTEGGVVAELDQGRELTITGAPVNGDGILWYPVAAQDDPAVAGFIADEYLDPAV